MTLERAVEELVAATLHAEDTRRADVVTMVLGRARLLNALSRYRAIAGVKKLRVVSALLEAAVAATG